MQDGMYLNSEATMLLHDEVIQVFGNFILKNQGRGNLAGTFATRTNLAGVDVGFRFHPLTRNLHQSKLLTGSHG